MSNVDSIREGFEAFARGDLDTIRSKMSPDIVWHVPGRGRLAGDKVGVDAVLGYFGQLFERTGGTFRAELLECAELAPDRVVCLVRLTGDAPAGRVDQQIVQIYDRRDDLTIACHNFPSDQYAMDEADPAEVTLPDARTGQEPRVRA